MATPRSSPTIGLTTGPGGCTIAAPTTPLSGLTLFTCYTLSGAVNVTGGFVDTGQDPFAPSCAEWASHGVEPAGTSALQAPDPGDAGISVGGQVLGFDLEIVPYTGPGTYTSAGVAQIVNLGTSQSWSNDAHPTAATFSAEVEADGSGSISVTHLENDASNGAAENVSERWVCVMERGA